MSILSERMPAAGPSAGPRALLQTATFVTVGAIAFLAATRVAAPSVTVAVGLAAGIGIAVWMFFSESMDGPLVVFLLYLGLLDGFLKLRTNSSVITLGRDALLFAIELGFLARAVLQRRRLSLPPLSGWPLAFTVLVLAQIANPADGSLVHTLGALRPHLEFVPLFFVGYAVLQTPKRLRAFFMILVVIAAANGIVGAIQLDLTPAQLSAWGPGYAARIEGTGTGVNQVSARVFYTSSGAARTRPFGLGDDSGVGGGWGMLALGGALALVALATRRTVGRFALLLCLGPPLAIVSGESRAVLVASLIALVAYICLATTARRLVPTLMGVVFGLAALVAVVAYISSVAGAGVFDRYATITPSKIAATTNADRGSSLSLIPTFFTKYPLGNGLGSSGPAAEFAGGGNTGSNAETEPTFLLSELGIPGLLLVAGFYLRLLWLGVTRVRRLEPDTRIFVAALLAGFFALATMWVASTTTDTSPYAPYTWFAGGALSYWLVTHLQRDETPRRRAGPGMAVATRARVSA
ncbi:MAG: hypothetical protein ABSH51_02350 [Solirubrobacteraceae bacterium]